MKFCGKCGNKISGTEKFCAKCGCTLENKLKEEPKTTLNSNTDTNSDMLTKSTSQTTTKVSKKINKSLIITLVSIISSVLVIAFLLILGKVYINKKYAPESIVDSFSAAIKKSNISELKKLLYSEDENLLTDENLNSLVTYYNENPSELKPIIKSLNKDCKNIDELTNVGDTDLLSDDEYYALTIKSSNFIFTKYNILIDPIYIDVYSNIEDTELFIGDSTEALAVINDNKTVGPFLPIESEITFKAKGFKDDIIETVTISPYDSELYVFDDYGYIDLTSNYTDGKIFVNGLDSGISIKDLENGTFGPVKERDTIYLSQTVNDKEYTSRSTTYYTHKESAELNFYSYDLKVLQNSSPSTDSPITSGNVDDYISKYKNRDFIIPTSNSAELTFKDLNNYSVEELFLARNEMFARHGLVFASSPNLQKFFESKSWYKADENYTGDLNTDVEDLNAGMIKSVEFLKMAHTNNPAITTDYVLPESSTKEYSSDEIAKLNDWELIVARNEIYARYGLEFSTIELLNHFKSKSWFKIDSSVGNDIALNAIENKNIATLVAEEQSRYYNRLNHDLGK